jgi:hypothetical protein
MFATKLQVKLFVERPEKLNLEAFVPMFHAWIKNDVLGELVIDVVDYAHVERGPGVVLVGDGSDYHLDLSQGRPGLLYSRKRRAPDDLVGDAFRRALGACQLIEKEPSLGGVRFRTDELLVRIADRLAAPNTPETLERLRPDLSPVLARLYAGAAFRLEPVGSPKEMFTLSVRAESAPGVAAMLERASAPAD